VQDCFDELLCERLATPEPTLSRLICLCSHCILTPLNAVLRFLEFFRHSGGFETKATHDDYLG